MHTVNPLFCKQQKSFVSSVNSNHLAGDFNAYDYNKGGNNMDLKDEDNSWTHLFNGYRDEGY